jgi:hypothetical protein
MPPRAVPRSILLTMPGRVWQPDDDDHTVTPITTIITIMTIMTITTGQRQ